MEENIRETKAILAANKAAEAGADGEGPAVLGGSDNKSMDDLPAFMLLEECWNSVQLARTEIMNYKDGSPGQDGGGRGKRSSGGSRGRTFAPAKMVASPSSRVSPKLSPSSVSTSTKDRSANKRRIDPRFTTLTDPVEERLEYSPWHNRTQGGYAGMREDATAIAIKEEFDERVERWKNEMPVEERTAQDRGKFCDYLTQHFLANRLDPLPSSDLIKSIRKEVASTIEKIDEIHVHAYMPKSDLSMKGGDGTTLLMGHMST